MNSKGQLEASSMLPENDFIAIGDSANRERQNKKRKIIIIAAIVAAALVAIVATILLAVNLGSNRSNSGNTNDTTVQSILATAKDKLKDPSEDADVSAMSSYLDSVLQEYSDGSNYQQLSKEDVASIYEAYGATLSDLVGNYNKYREKYISKILECYHKADDLAQTADSALRVYYAEGSFGSVEEALKYKQIAIDRGSKAFDSVEGGQG